MRYGSARQMVFGAYQASGNSVLAGAIQKARWGVDVQLGSRNSNDWCIVHGLEAGAVMSAVESQPPHLRALALYLFGPFSRRELDDEMETVQIALYRKILLSDGVRLPGQGKGRPTADMLETLRYLCAAAIYHHGEITWPYRRQGLPTPRQVQAWLMDECGIEIETRFWTRADRATWGAVWERMLRVLDSWEGECLGPVAALVPMAA